MKKMTITLMTLIVVLIVLTLTGNKSVHDELLIKASPEEVWSVLTNTNEYPEWNPVMELLSGEVKTGEKVIYKFTQAPGKSYEIAANIAVVAPNKTLNQKGGIPLILSFDHKYTLHAEEDQTRLIIHEDYKGIGVNFWNPKPVEKAYQQLNKAIKQRVENY